MGPVLWKTQAAAGQLLQLLKVSGWQASPVVKAGPPGATVQFSSPHPSTTCTALLSQPAGQSHRGLQGGAAADPELRDAAGQEEGGDREEPAQQAGLHSSAVQTL